MTSILTNDQGRVEHDDAAGIVSVTMIGFRYGDAYRELLMAALRVAQEKRSVTKLLIDTCKASVAPPVDQSWAISTWFPQVVRAGVREVAMVLPENVIAASQVKHKEKETETSAEIQDAVEYQTFARLEPALAWLRSA